MDLLTWIPSETKMIGRHMTAIVLLFIVELDFVGLSLCQFGHKPEHTFDTQLEDDEAVRQLSEELKQWKEGHRR